MILQTDSKLNISINKWGCYYLSIFYITLKVNKEKICPDPEIINSLAKKCLEKQCMDDYCYVMNPTSVSKIISQFFRFTYFCQYTGNHSTQYLSNNTVEILGCWYDKKTHFVVMNGMGKNKNFVEYDPMGKSNTVENGKMISTRVYKKIKN